MICLNWMLLSAFATDRFNRILLEDGLVTAAGRVAGAFRSIGDLKKADQIINDMKAAGYFDVPEIKPLEKYKPVLGGTERIVSPYVGRIQAMWEQMESRFRTLSFRSKKCYGSKRVLQLIQCCYQERSKNIQEKKPGQGL